MTEPDNGGPAFPIAGEGESWEEQGGMSLRDWFAGQALGATGMDIVSMMRRMPDRTGPDPDGNRRLAAEVIARDAYRIADAMLAARKPGGGE